MELIDKSAVVAEIENRIKKYTLLQQTPEMSDLQEELQNKIDCLNSIKGYILNRLEVKEVDLNEEIEKCLKRHNMLAVGRKDFTDIAKHFFELGLKAKEK